jgi:hypothetical protein
VKSRLGNIRIETAVARLLLAAFVAYFFIGLLYATGSTIYYELFSKNPDALAPPWSGPLAFLAWFLLPALLWPWGLVGFREIPEIAVACAYLATVAIFYLAASRWSAPRRLNSTYPDHH